MNDIRSILYALRVNGPLTIAGICEHTGLGRDCVTRIIKNELALEERKLPAQGRGGRAIEYSLARVYK